MAQLLSQVVLPIALAIMMLVMGLSLRPEHFKRVIQHPGLVLVGLLLQWLLLPAVALLLIWLLPLPAEVMVGLVILAACPGGATSNIISHLSGGDAALSVTLTAVISLLAPLTVPLWVNTQLDWLALDAVNIHLPWAKAVMPLVVVTVVPLLLGMTLAHFWPRWMQQHGLLLNRMAFALFAGLVVTLAWANAERLPALWSLVTLACLSLCLLAMIAAGLIGRLISRDEAISRTYMVEVGIQNAGTAMLVAVTLLNRPDLALVALFYGILMNLPALLLISQHQLRLSAYTKA